MLFMVDLNTKVIYFAKIWQLLVDYPVRFAKAAGPGGGKFMRLGGTARAASAVGRPQADQIKRCAATRFGHRRKFAGAAAAAA